MIVHEYRGRRRRTYTGRRALWRFVLLVLGLLVLLTVDPDRGALGRYAEALVSLANAGLPAELFTAAATAPDPDGLQKEVLQAQAAVGDVSRRLVEAMEDGRLSPADLDEIESDYEQLATEAQEGRAAIQAARVELLRVSTHPAVRSAGGRARAAAGHGYEP